MVHSLAQVRIDPSFWIWLGVLVVVVLIGGGVLLAVRRRLFSDDANADFQAGGILEQIRTLRAEGKISQEEYDETRKVLIAKASQPQSGPEEES